MRNRLDDSDKSFHAAVTVLLISVALLAWWLLA